MSSAVDSTKSSAEDAAKDSAAGFAFGNHQQQAKDLATGTMLGRAEGDFDACYADCIELKHAKGWQ